ncbi:MAG: magnesium/cobalt transporter CorA [Prochlorococcaceae cyanobacterium]
MPPPRVRVHPRRRPQPASERAAIRRPSSQAAAFLAPGTPVFVGERKQEQATLHLIHFDRERLHEVEKASLEDCRHHLRAPGVTWVNVNGVHDVGLIEALGDVFGLHPMTMEDIADTSQRPKWEEFPGYSFMALKMLAISAADAEVQIEHVSLILGPSWVLTFLEDDGDVFASVRSRIRGDTGRVRSLGADYLASCLIDAVIDHYFLAVEWISDQIEIFDTHVLNHPEAVRIQEIHHFKRGLLALRRAVWPMREVLGAISKSEASVVSAKTSVFWRNLYDHTVQVIDMVETSRDTLASVQDTYLSSLSNRMNSVMKTLTVISTIFIPLTFIAGVYGMNFQNMPELTWRLGYYGVLVLMLVIAVALVVWIRSRGWL